MEKSDSLYSRTNLVRTVHAKLCNMTNSKEMCRHITHKKTKYSQHSLENVGCMQSERKHN